MWLCSNGSSISVTLAAVTTRESGNEGDGNFGLYLGRARMELTSVKAT
jgi:hypothetical protein